MNFRPTSLERAFELAKSGECKTVADIRKRLKDEGLSVAQIEGPRLTKQLRELCVESSAAAEAKAANEA